MKNNFFGEVFVLLCALLILFSSAYTYHDKSDKSRMFNNEIVKALSVIDSPQKAEIVVIDSVEEKITYDDWFEYRFTYDVADRPFENEWAAFNHQWRYKYEPIVFKDSSYKILLTNILYRESGMLPKNQREEVDQYLVALCAIRWIQAHPEYLENPYIYRAFYIFTVPVNDNRVPNFKLNKDGTKASDYVYNLRRKSWLKCRAVVENVLECRIPKHIPYVPHGTYCYWNDDLDTDLVHGKRLEKHYANIVTTIRNHHYYADPRDMTKEELEYLVFNKPCNPLKKRINNGIFCN